MSMVAGKTGKGVVMKSQDVYVFVFDSLSDWEPAYATAAIGNPQFQKNPGRYRVRTVALGPDPVCTMGGMRIVPDLTLDAVSPADSAMLILPGGLSWEKGENGEAVEKARVFLDAGVPVAAICAATWSLARGGLLDHRRHTSNHRSYLAGTQYRGGALYEEAPAVTDEDLITASGIAPIEFARHIFRRLDFYTPEALEAWYELFKNGNYAPYGALLQAKAAQC